MKPYGEYPPDYDQIEVDFERSEVRRARVPHKCSVCCQLIQPGQRYLRVFAVVEGEPQTQLSHGLVIASALERGSTNANMAVRVVVWVGELYDRLER